MTIFVIKHPLYISLLFRSPLKIILLLYDKYILHLHRQCERVVICTKKMCIYVICKNIYITLQIFLFIPFSVPRFSNNQSFIINNDASIWVERSRVKREPQAIKKHKLEYRKRKKTNDEMSKLAGSPRRRVPCCHSDFKSVLKQS